MMAAREIVLRALLIMCDDLDETEEAEAFTALKKPRLEIACSRETSTWAA
jgi:hypothetical protein